MITKECPICGKTFDTNNYRAKYCSDECKKQGRKITAGKWRDQHPDYHKEWYKEHPDYQREWAGKHPNYSRDRNRRKRGTVEIERKCVVCGRTFTTVMKHQLTCSRECSMAHEKARQREKSQDPERSHDRWIRKRYGSEEKRIEYLEEKKRQAERDRAEREAREKAEKEARLIHKECVVCGKEFTTHNPKQRTCCKECGKKLNYARKRRIPKEQIIDKDITLEALFRRDSGVCYLCGGACDWSDKVGRVVGDKYPSIDHVIPIAAGGMHSWDNVRLAHFRCNTNKSDKILPQISKLDPAFAYKYKRELRSAAPKRTKQLSMSGEVVAIYGSTGEAARATGIKSKGIQNCARGECKSYGGYQWMYV